MFVTANHFLVFFDELGEIQQEFASRYTDSKELVEALKKIYEYFGSVEEPVGDDSSSDHESQATTEPVLTEKEGDIIKRYLYFVLPVVTRKIWPAPGLIIRPQKYKYVEMVSSSDEAFVAYCMDHHGVVISPRKNKSASDDEEAGAGAVSDEDDQIEGRPAKKPRLSKTRLRDSQPEFFALGKEMEELRKSELDDPYKKEQMNAYMFRMLNDFLLLKEINGKKKGKDNSKSKRGKTASDNGKENHARQVAATSYDSMLLSTDVDDLVVTNLATV